MSDPVSNHDIEDVLSSIRRLVAQGDPRRTKMSPPAPEPLHPEPSQTVEKQGDPDAASAFDRLILTPSLRVTPDNDNNSVAADPEPVIGHAPMAPVAESVQAEPASSGRPDRASLEATIAELEAAVCDVPDDFEPDGSETIARDVHDQDSIVPPLRGRAAAKAPPEPTSETPADPEAAVSAAVFDHVGKAVTEELAGAFPNLNAAETKKDVDSTVVPLTRERRPAAETPQDDVVVVRPKVHKPTGFRFGRSKVTPDEAAPAAESGADTPQETATPELVTPTPADTPSFRTFREDVYDPVAEATADAAEADAVARTSDVYGDELATDTDQPGTAVAEKTAPTALTDPDMLRDMVGQMIRDELQGEMGERITRNVRKLVRREINRVLSEQDFS